MSRRRKSEGGIQHLHTNEIAVLFALIIVTKPMLNTAMIGTDVMPTQVWHTCVAQNGDFYSDGTKDRFIFRYQKGSASIDLTGSRTGVTSSLSEKHYYFALAVTPTIAIRAYAGDIEGVIFSPGPESFNTPSTYALSDARFEVWHSAAHKKTTEIIFFGKETSGMLYSYNYVAKTFISTATLEVGEYRGIHFSKDIIFTFGSFLNVYLRNPMNLASLATVALPRGVYNTVLDEAHGVATESVLFTSDISPQASFYALTKRAFDHGTATMTVEAQNSDSLPTLCQGMILIPNLELLLTSAINDLASRIYAKADLSVVASFNEAYGIILDDVPSYHSLTFGRLVGDKYYFGFATTTSKKAGVGYLTVENCLSPLSMTCIECKSGFYLLTISFNNECKTISSGYGVVTSNPVLIEPCQVAHCSDCSLDSTTCTQCSPGYYLTFNEYTACYQTRLGYGKNLLASPFHLKSCATPGCQTCSTDYSICQECLPGFSLKANDASKACFLLPQSGFGLTNATIATIDSCATPGCQTCAADFQVCIQCVSGQALKSDDPNKLCHLLPQSGYGFSSASTIEISRCTDPNCQICNTALHLCDKCKIETGMRVCRQTRCCFTSLPGMGINLNQPDYLDRCVAVGCSNCSFDHTQCLDPPPQPAQCLDTYSLSFIRSKNTIKVVFSNHMDSVSLSAIQVRVTSSASESQTVDLLEPVYTSENKTLQGKIFLAKQCLDCTIEMFSKLTTNPIRELSAPMNCVIIILAKSNVDIDPNTVLKTLTDQTIGTTQTLVGALTTTAGLINTSSASGAGVSYLASQNGVSGIGSVLKLISTLEYLVMINGEKVIFSDRYLQLFRNDPLKLMRNYMEIDESKLMCTPTVNFERENVSCSSVNNFGAEIIAVGACVILALTFGWLGFLIEKLDRERALYKVLKNILCLPTKIFSKNLLFGLIEGSHMEAFRVAILDLKTKGMGNYRGFGFVISCSILVGYTIFALLMVRHIRSRSSMIDGKKPLYLSYKAIFQGFRTYQKEGWFNYNYLPLLVMGKNLISQTILVFFGGTSSRQIYLLLTVEIFGLGLSIASLKAMTSWKKYCIFGSAVCYVLIILCYQILARQRIDYETREGTFGWILCCLYTCLIALVVLPILFDAFIETITSLKTICKRLSSKQKFPTPMKKPSSTPSNTNSISPQKVCIGKAKQNDISSKKVLEMHRLNELKDNLSKPNQLRIHPAGLKSRFTKRSKLPQIQPLIDSKKVLSGNIKEKEESTRNLVSEKHLRHRIQVTKKLES